MLFVSVEMHELRFETSDLHDVEVIRLTGAIEPVNFADLAAVINRFLRDGKTRMVLDCARVSYIGSNELLELLDLARYARAAGGDIKLAGLSASIQQVANLIAMGDPMDCYSELSDAVQSFRSQGSMATAHK